MAANRRTPSCASKTACRKPKLDAAGKPVPFKIAYPDKDDKGDFLTHPDAGSVVGVTISAGSSFRRQSPF